MVVKFPIIYHRLPSYMGVSLNGGIPKTPQKDHFIFCRKTHGCWVPPFSETSIYIIRNNGLFINPKQLGRFVHCSIIPFDETYKIQATKNATSTGPRCINSRCKEFMSRGLATA